MTIQELIDLLQKEENKEAKIWIKYDDGTFKNRAELEAGYMNVDGFYILTND